MQQTKEKYTPNFLDSHNLFIEKNFKTSVYRINDMNIVALPNVYRPTPECSSIFMLRTIQERYKDIKIKKNKLLDIGCGTGFVGLSLKSHFKEIYLSDIMFKSILCSRINALINFRKAKIYHSDLFNSLPKTLFDVILFNIPLLDKPIEHPAELTTNDPGGRLFTKFIQQVSQYLAPNGEIFFPYSTLGDINLLQRIPAEFNLEKIATIKYEAFGHELYLFRLTMA